MTAEYNEFDKIIRREGLDQSGTELAEEEKCIAGIKDLINELDRQDSGRRFTAAISDSDHDTDTFAYSLPVDDAHKEYLLIFTNGNITVVASKQGQEEEFENFFSPNENRHYQRHHTIVSATNIYLNPENTGFPHQVILQNETHDEIPQLREKWRSAFGLAERRVVERERQRNGARLEGMRQIIDDAKNTRFRSGQLPPMEPPASPPTNK